MGHALHVSARGLQHLVDGFGQQGQVGGGVDQACAQQKQVVVVAGEAFKEPQQFGVVFAFVVVARQFGRAQALDVPGVEVFVADKAEQGGVTVAGLGRRAGARIGGAGQVAALADEGGGVAVFQPAIAVLCGVQQEHVLAKGWGVVRAVPEVDLGGADFLRVGQQACAIKTGRRAADDEAVRDAAYLELVTPEGAELERAVGEFVVIGGQVAAKAVRVGVQGGQAGGHLPAVGVRMAHHAESVRQVVVAMHAQAQAGGVEKAALGVEVGGAYRGIEGVDLVAQGQGGDGGRRVGGGVVAEAGLGHVRARLPGVLVELLQRQRLAAAFGAQVLQVLRKFAHQVAARDPHRQAEALLARGLVDFERDAEQVRVRVEHFHPVAHGGGAGGGCGGGVGGGHGVGVVLTGRLRRASSSGRRRWRGENAASASVAGPARGRACGRTRSSPPAPAPARPGLRWGA